jgi:predicted nucleic acid-binding protein
VAVAYASALIALSKMRRLRLLKEVFGSVAMGPMVKAEALDQGRAIAAPGVEQIEAALQEGWLRLVRATPSERRLISNVLKRSRLDPGEAEALALAESRTLVLIVDDKEGRAVAASLGVAHLGTAGVLLEAFLRGFLSFEELEEAVGALSSILWLSPRVVTEILRRAREGRT